MDNIEHKTLSGDSRTKPLPPKLADFHRTQLPKEREAAARLLAFATVKHAAEDPLAANGKLQPPTLYMEQTYDFFRAGFPSKPFPFQTKIPESYYRKTLVPKFNEVLSERFLGLPKHKQRLFLELRREAQAYYLEVLIAAVRSEIPQNSVLEALGFLCCYINEPDTTSERLVAYLNRSEISEAIAEAHNEHPRVYQLLCGWKELFGD